MTMKIRQRHGLIIEKNGLQRWYVFGLLHREDGPAAIYPNGTLMYYINGLRHRVGEPAVIYPNGLKQYYEKDVLHRVDGPAEIMSNGKFNWYIKGLYVRSSYIFQRMTGISDEELMLLILKYGEIG